MAVDLSRIDTVVLCGGKGRRLRRLVSDRPKPLADFGGVPFLGLLMDYCALFGLRRFVLCAGYKGEMVRRAARRMGRSASRVRCVLEKSARGTGGAVAGARRLIKSDPFIVLNGDSFCGADLGRLLAFHRRKRAGVSIVVVPSRRTAGRGNVVLGSSGRIVSFEEKGRSRRPGDRRSFDNTGVYMMDRAVLRRMPKPPFSLERDFFPRLIRSGGRVYGRIERKPLIDFGTPAGYRRARYLWSGGRLRLRRAVRGRRR